MIDFPCMLRNRKAYSLRLLLASSLCLLAVAFGLEAKIAWYGSAAGPRSEISSAKALRPDAMQLVGHGRSVTAPSRVSLRFTLAAGVAACLPQHGRIALRKNARNIVNTFSRKYLSSLSLRAPPTRS